MSSQATESDELILGPWLGFAIGTIWGAGLVAFLSPRLGLDFTWMGPNVPFLVSAVAGALYGACQLRVPVRGLLAVGVFYGVFLWVLSNLLGLFVLSEEISIIRSWPGIGLYLLFTVGLAACSVAKTLVVKDLGPSARH